MGGIAPIAVGFRIPERSLSSSTSSGTKLGSSASFEELVWTAPKRARRLRGVQVFIYFKYNYILQVQRSSVVCTESECGAAHSVLRRPLRPGLTPCPWALCILL
jgi:hypothetical protein